MVRARVTRSSSGGAPTPKEVVGAAQRADLRAMKALHARGADWNASYRNYRPLHALIQEEPHGSARPSKGRLAALKWLLEHGADPEQAGAWPSASALLVAAFGGVDELVEPLLEGGAKRTFHARCALGELPRVRAALEGDQGLAHALDGAGVTPLHAAAGSRLACGDARRAERQREICALLLEAGADPNARVRSWGHEVDPAYFAVASRDAGRLELLLARGADATRALGSAMWSGDLGMAQTCLDRGAEIDGRQPEGRPALNELIRWGQVEPALWLIARGASPDVADARGWTAMHQAASRGNERVLRALIAAGGSIATRDAEGRTPHDVASPRTRTRLGDALLP